MSEEKKSYYTESQKRAAQKYLSGLDEIRIRLPKGQKSAIRAAAESRGESMNEYILSAIRARMESESKPEANQS